MWISRRQKDVDSLRSLTRREEETATPSKSFSSASKKYRVVRRAPILQSTQSIESFQFNNTVINKSNLMWEAYKNSCKKYSKANSPTLISYISPISQRKLIQSRTAPGSTKKFNLMSAMKLKNELIDEQYNI
jgi:hypothetical protein